MTRETPVVPIAIVGAACRVPGADTLAGLWDLLRSGTDVTGPAPAHRWNADDAPPPGGYLERIDLFDADFFGISPREAAALDPQQRMALELAWHAAESAGIPVEALETHGPAAVFLGAMWDDYAGLTHHHGAVDRHSIAGLRRGMVANRVSHALGAHGPSVTVDSAQSSSLVAIHLACETLRRGEAALALAGGVNVVIGSSVTEVGEFGALSPTGRCRPFDAGADGFARGEGGGVLVLKTLERARADGDHVHAVVLGSATNNDGGGRPLAVPSVDGQRDVLHAAQRAAGVTPARVGYVELHGTGTPVGDRAEAAALSAVFGPDRAHALPVGSVKSNIGHLEAAAGVLGVLKTALCLEHATLVPSLHFTRPPADLPLDEWALRVQTRTGPWPDDTGDGARVAGVSSFGMGGANCHVVLAAAEPDLPPVGRDGHDGPWPVLLGAAGAAALPAQAAALAAHVRDTGDRVADVALSALTTRSALPHRAAVIAADRDELLAGLDALASREPDSGPGGPGGTGGTGGTDVSLERADGGPCAYVFSGQGGARPGMGARLAEAAPDVAAVLDAVTDLLRPTLGIPLRDVLCAEDGSPAAAALRSATYAQPALFALQVALYRYAEARGAPAGIVTGHSLGEITAAHVAGVLSLESAVGLVAERGRLTDTLPADGAMIVVRAAATDVMPLLAGHEDVAGIAGVNGPRSSAVSGSAAAVSAISERARARGWRTRALDVTHAFHSPHVDAVTDAFGAAIADVAFAPARLPLVSAALGRLVEPDEPARPQHWVHHLRTAVRFDDALAALVAAGARTLTEIGPDAGLTALARECLEGTSAHCAPIMRPGRDEVAEAVAALGRMHARGVARLDAEALRAGRPARRVPLPGYSFRRRSFWLAPAAPASGGAPASPAPVRPAVEPAVGPAAVAPPRPPASTATDPLEQVRAVLAAVLGHAGGGDVDPDRAFTDLGLDSAGSVELAQALGHLLGTEVDSALLWEHATPRALAAFLAAPAAPAAPAPVTGPPIGVGGDDPVAVVSMACRLPGGIATPEDLWALLADHGDATSEFPTDRGWDLEALYDPDPEHPGTTYTRRGGFLHGVDGFDAEFFGISPREARAMDPQQRLLLETSWEALERAGIVPGDLRGSATGVYVGVSASDYGARLADACEQDAGYVLTGSSSSVASGRVAYTLGLEGPTLTVDTACSSSLVAVHLGVRALRSGDCDLVLAGGAAVMATPGMFLEFSRQRGLAPDGRCKPFAAAADGTAWAEGAGMVLLERLSDARRRGHRVLAVIRGSAINADGASNGLTAPSGGAQQRVVGAALVDAGLAAADVDAVEAHGTGTLLGDPIEARALQAVYGAGRPPGAAPLWLGSLKSNIGHTAAAAGVAGLIKTVLALGHGRLPATRHVDAPTDRVHWDERLSLLVDDVEWPRTGRPRRAAVSAFGISGTNAHVVLEQAPETADPEPDSEPEPDTCPGAVVALTLSARSPETLAAQAAGIAEHLAGTPAPTPAALARALATTRTRFEHRATLVGADRGELVEGLRGLAAGVPPGDVVVGRAGPGRRTAFAFPGQGGQWVGMGAELLATVPVFATAIDRCAQALAPHVDWSLHDVLADAPGAASLARVDVVQPALWAMMVALAEVWQACGVTPDAVVGHSQGEIAAAVVAGALDLDAGALVVARRAAALTRLAGRGTMASLPLPADDARAEIEQAGLAATVEVAAHNGPRTTAVSGAADDVVALVSRLAARGVDARRIDVDYASHSAHVELVADELARELAGVAPRPARIPFYSAVHAAPVDGTALDAAYWYENLRRPVMFAPTVARMIDDGVARVIEPSPHGVLTVGIEAVAAECPGADGPDGDVAVIPTLRRDDHARVRLLTALARADLGGDVDLTPVLPAAPAGALPTLPTYPFARRRFWLDASARPGGAEDSGHALLPRAHRPAPGDTLLLSGRLTARTPGWLADHVVDGRVLVPGVALLDAALHAGAMVGCDEVEELVLLAPLELPDDGAVEVQLALGAPGDPGGTDRPGTRAVTVHARRTGHPDGDWVRHATGRVRPAGAAAEPPTTTHAAPTAGTADLYVELAAAGYAYGPAFRSARALERDGDVLRVALALERTDDTGPDPRGHAVHPALLDGALHPLLRHDGDTLRLPFTFAGVRLLASGATSGVADVRVDGVGGSGDRAGIVVRDAAGAPVLAMDAVTLRAPERAPSRPGGRGSLHRTRWLPAPDAPTGRAGAVWRVPEGAEDADAVAALLLDALERVRDASEESPLTVLTRGGVDAGGPVTDAGHAAVWGLVRSAQREHPGRLALLDLDPRSPGSDGTPRVAPDTQRAWRGTLLAPATERLDAAVGTSDDPGAGWGDGTVVVLGGTGAVGAATARHLVEHRGVRRLVLASRRGAGSAGAMTLAADLEGLGAEVRVEAVDVTDAAAVVALYRRAAADGPVTGTVFAPGVIADATVAALGLDELRRVLLPKIAGVTVAAAAAREVGATGPFVVFSSVAGLAGWAGQANYAAANAFLDGWASAQPTRTAAHDDGPGLRVRSVQWGLWELESGMTAHMDAAARARLDRLGVVPLPTADGLALLDAVVALPDHDSVVAAGAFRAGAGPLHGPPPAPRRAAVGAPSASGADHWAGLEHAERRRRLAEIVARHAADVRGGPVGSDRAFRDQGFDSLTALELRNRLAAEVGVRLPATVLFDFPTPDAVVTRLAELLAATGSDATAGATAATTAAATAADDPVVIVGMGCRFPGGIGGPEQLWEAVLGGREVVGPFPTDRGWAPDLFDPDPESLGHSSTDRGGFLEDAGGFDAELFGVSPREALAMDPQQRLILEVSWEALERAGIDPRSLGGSDTGVFVGSMYDDYAEVLGAVPEAAEGYVLTGTSSSVMSGRIAYTFGLQGPALTVDTACSSSLVALHLACASLRSAECATALVGGATIMATPQVFREFSRQRGLSPDGRCRSYGDDADGTGWSEGAGVLVLQRLSRARAQGRRVLAVVAGSAVNSDGASNGLTAPNGPAQERVIRSAWRAAGVSGTDVDLVEGHGTGTRLGDPIEVGALQATYGADRDTSPAWLGSVKSNLGHTQAAAGVAGVIKSVLALRHGVVPPTRSTGSPSSHVTWGDGLALADGVRPWPERDGAPRRAAVSSFGISGTNAHVILSAAPDEPTVTTPGTPDAAPLVWPLSAATPEAMVVQGEALAQGLVAGSPAAAVPAGSVASTLVRGRALLPSRAVVVSPQGDRDELTAGLRDLGSRSVVSGAVDPGVRAGGVGWVFSGQGSQRAGMGVGLGAGFPGFAVELGRVCGAFEGLLEGPSLAEVMASGEGLDRTEWTQPAVFAFGVAAARWLGSFGVEPAVLGGHSVGEITAAHLAGVLDLGDAARLVAARARLMGGLPPGGVMLAVESAEQELANLLTDLPGVDVAAVNAPRSVVLSGDEGAVDAVRSALAGRGVRCRRLAVSHAFHSRLMEPMLDRFAAEIADLELRAPARPLLSAVSGGLAGAEVATTEYWAEHVRRPVRFADTVSALADAGVGAVLEIGASAPLLPMIRATAPELTAVALQAGRPAADSGTDRATDSGTDGGTDVDGAVGDGLRALAGLHVVGVDVDWSPLLPATAAPVDLPTYRFTHHRYWPTPGGDATPSASAPGAEPTGHPLLPAITTLAATGARLLTGSMSLARHPWLADHAVGGTTVVSGTTWLEIVGAAGREAGLPEIVELRLLAPATVPDDGALEVQVVVDPDRTGTGDGDTAGHARVAVHTRSADTDWTPVATASVGPAGPTGTSSARIDEAPVPTDDTGRVLALDELYARIGDLGAEHGPSFQPLRGARRDEFGVTVDLDPTVSALPAGLALDPGLLDGALHTLLDGSERLRVPALWRGVRVLRPGAAPRAARLEVDPDDAATWSIRLTDDDGVIAEIDGLTLAELDPDALRPTGDPAADLHVTVWLPLPVGDAAIDRDVPDPVVVDAGPPAGADGDVLAALVRVHAELVAALEQDDRLVVVLTRGAVTTPGDEATGRPAVDVAGAAVWGLVRSAMTEHPGRLLLIDRDPGEPGPGDHARGGPRALGATLVRCGEDQAALRDGGILVPRLRPARAAGELLAAPGGAVQHLEPGPGRTVDDLRFAPADPSATDPAGAPAAGHVVVRIEAAGVNFRDVLMTLGTYPGETVLGSEAAGTVLAVGEGVADLRAGDRVMGLVPHAFAAVGTTDRRHLVRLPEHWDAADGASVPVAFLTAYRGLVDLADARPGQRVLVHAAAGGVGQAAIALARHLGLEVWATCHPGKTGDVEALGVPRARIASSRDLGFATAFPAGFDIVLNSLTGAALEASLRLTRPEGVFLEMGKADVRDPAAVAAAHEGVRYRAYDMLDAGPDRIAAMLAALADLLAAGTLAPLPTQVAPLAAARSVLRTMSRGEHRGKLVLRPGGGFDPRGAVLLVGGTGALGRRVAEHLVQHHGVRALTLTGRRGRDADGVPELVERLRAAGAQVDVVAADATDRDATAAVIAAVEAARPLRSVIVTAGVVDDAALASLTPDRIEAVLRAKVDTARNLHELTAGRRLEHFVLFSSVAGALGTAGQANYAAANAAIDALTLARRARGLPAHALAWGPWSGDGMAAALDDTDLARLARAGVRPLDPETSLALLDLALTSARPVLVPARLDPPGRAATPGRSTLLAGDPGERAGSRPPAPRAGRTAVVDTLASQSEPERRDTLTALVRETAAATLGLGSPSRVTLRRTFGELGFDSLTAVELANRLHTATGVRLPATAAFDHPTPVELVDRLVTDLAALLPARSQDAGCRRGAEDDVAGRADALADALADVLAGDTGVDEPGRLALMRVEELLSRARADTGPTRGHPARGADGSERTAAANGRAAASGVATRNGTRTTPPADPTGDDLTDASAAEVLAALDHELGD